MGHPAHFHLFKNVIKCLDNNHQFSILIKKKDVLEELLDRDKIRYINILPEGRKNTKFGLITSLIKRDARMFKYCIKNKPDLMVGTSPEICHVGKLLGIPSINVNEDDALAVPYYANSSYPFASVILSPVSCDNYKWNYKSIKYNSYHELSYLHPKYFQPNSNVLHNYDINQPYFVVRFSGLDAHHDKGIQGINNELGCKIIAKLQERGRVLITSERILNQEFEKFRMYINPLDIHDILYYSDMYIGDSQTMTAEAAVLGVPSIRFNDFVGKLGYLEELEHKYGLTYGIKTSEPEKLFQKIDELLSMLNIKEEWQRRRQKMLSEKIDITAFLVWFIENYPESVKVMKENPDYQYKFK